MKFHIVKGGDVRDKMSSWDLVTPFSILPKMVGLK